MCINKVLALARGSSTVLFQLLTEYKPASKWLALINYLTVYRKICSCFTAEEHVHMAVTEGELLTSGKQNKLQNVLGIKRKKGAALEGVSYA